jgi:hypothetical protein
MEVVTTREEPITVLGGSYRVFHPFCCLKTSSPGPDFYADFATAVVKVDASMLCIEACD